MPKIPSVIKAVIGKLETMRIKHMALKNTEPR